jgi:hypothetical protein
MRMTQQEHEWKLVKAEVEDEVMIVRLRRGLEPVIRGAKHLHGLQVVVHYKSRSSGLLPDVEEMELLDDIEARFRSRLESDNVSVLAIVVTGPTMREFVFYTTNPEVAQAQSKEIKQSIPSHEISLVVQADASWRMYHEFVSQNN